MIKEMELSAVDQMKEFIDERETRLDKEQWISGLDDRKREESQFHDKVRHIHATDHISEAAEVGTRKNSSFYDVAEASFEHSREWIRQNAPGNIVLDYACGNGGNAIKAAKAGAGLSIGLDISPTSVENGRKVAEEQGVSGNTRFMVGDCENTGLPDNSVDRIICMGCLHHLDLSYAIPELRRILKPGGKIYVHESLAYNPVIKIYRKLTPHLRTTFEKDHILSLREVQFAKRFFRIENVRYFHFFSIGAIPLLNTRFLAPALKVADALDRVFLKVKPFSYLAWQFTFEMVKPEKRG